MRLFCFLFLLSSCESVRVEHEPPPYYGGGDYYRPVGDGPSFWTPNPPCRPLVLPCLDASDPDVIEVPTEATLQEAFDAVIPGQVVQIRSGLQVPSGWWIPQNVTFRGCEGAEIISWIAFDGGGIIEGFQITGSVILKNTGTYTVRHNYFAGSSSEPAISLSASEGLLGASVTATIDGNSFKDRPLGIDLYTRYDTQTRRLDVTVQNNIFSNVATPVYAVESGLVGEIDLTMHYNTVVGFETAIELYDVTPATTLRANIFDDGQLIVDADSPFEVLLDIVGEVTDTHTGPLVSGAFTSGDPDFANSGQGDFRLTPSSDALDVDPTAAPLLDYYGCNRPVDAGDAGALEAQK